MKDTALFTAVIGVKTRLISGLPLISLHLMPSRCKFGQGACSCEKASVGLSDGTLHKT